MNTMRAAPVDRGRQRLVGTMAMAGLAIAVLLWFLMTGTGAALPNLGVHETALPADTTLADLIDDLGDPANAYGTGTDYVGAFSSTGLGGLSLLVGTGDDAGKYATDPGVQFSLTATATIPGSGLTYRVLVHAEPADTGDPTTDPATLVVALQSSAGSLAELLPLTSGSAMSDVHATSWGLTFFQGGGDIDIAPPGAAAQFLADTLGESTLTLPVVDQHAGAMGLAAELDAAEGWNGLVGIVGAEGQTAMPASGTAAASFSDFVAGFSGGSTKGYAVLAGVSIEVTAGATGPAWTSDAATIGLDATSDDWTFTIDYDQADTLLQLSGAGPTWDITVPELFPGGTTFAPDMFVAHNVTPGIAPVPLRVGGEIGAFTIPGTTNEITVGAAFTKNASTYVADFYGTVDITSTKSADFDIYIQVADGSPSVTLTGVFPDVTVQELQTLVGTDQLDGSDVPASFRTTSLTGPVVAMEISPGSFAIGATGRLEQSVLAGDATVGVSLMMYAELDDTPMAMVGVAPSVRPIGVDDPEGDHPIMLSDILDTPGGDFDIEVYDPDDPTLGIGVVFSTAQSRLGGDECTSSADPCPAANARQDVTTNVAQWLMPLWGYDGSNEAVYDSTSLEGQCLICSFREDFQPATSFVVPQGLTVAGTLVMPQPLGSADDLTACETSPDSDACKEALGMLGSIGLASRVTVTGSVPIPGFGGDFGLTLAVGLLDESVADRPTWLHDAGLRVSVTAGPTGIQFGLNGTLDIAVKQGFSHQQAEGMFGAGSQLAIDNTLQPVAPGSTCARGGVVKVERDSSAGFTAGDSYCHDLLRLLVDAQVSAGTDGVTVQIIGDLQSILEDGTANPDGWAPMGFDKFSIGQVTATVGIETGTGGTAVTLGGAFSGSIETTPNIPFAAALQLQFQPNLVVFDGMRLDVAQVSLDNIVEIYEWISGQNVPDDIELPGVSLRNLSLSVGTKDIQPLCIGAGFSLSGDLYISDDPGPTDLPLYSCDADPNSATFGQLSPAPTAACGPAEIDAGCVAGIRLDINDRGVVGDAFIAEFNAGPVHVFAPATGEIPDNAEGRGVSIHVEISKTKAYIQLFGGAALGGSATSTNCSGGKYCDAWASGDFNGKLTAGIGGVNVKLYGRVKSGLPGLSFQMLVAGELNIPGATELASLFTQGTIPDSNFAFHVELANADAAPDLDFAAALQADIDDEFASVLDGLNDAKAIAEKLRVGDAAGAKKLLEEYGNNDPVLSFMIDLVADIKAGASDADLNAKLDWFLDGVYFGLPGVPNIVDLATGVKPPRCDGLNYGYGPSGKKTYDTKTENYYPYNFCFLHKPFKIEGACHYLNKTNCTLDDVLQELLIEPIVSLVIAGIDLSIDVTQFAHDAVTFVLAGELFRLDCASFDISLATSQDLDNGFDGEIQIGLFLTLFGQDIGASFEWDFGENFAYNAKALAGSVIEALSGTTTSTCWSNAELQAFFGDEIDDDPDAPPTPAVITSVVVTDTVTGKQNVVVEGNPATATITYDKGVDTTRSVAIEWGDGGSGPSIAVATGATGGTSTHTYLDDGASSAATENKTVVVTDGNQVIKVPVSVVNADPTIVSIVPSATSINENDTLSLTVKFTDPGVLDSHVVSVVWDDGADSEVAVTTEAAKEVTLSHQYLQNPLDESADILVTITDKDGGEVSQVHEVEVLNVAPVLTGFGPVTATEGLSQDYVITWTDPGTLDNHALAIDWGHGLSAPATELWMISDDEILVDLDEDGTVDRTLPITTAGLVRSVTVPHTYRDDDPTATAVDTYDVKVTIADLPDGDTDKETYQVDVYDVAPVVRRDVASQTIQYSDEIGTVTVTATDVSLDTLVAAATITDAAGTVRSFDVAGLTLSPTPACVPIADDRQSCTWEVNGIVDDGAGTYEIAVTVTDDDTLATTVTSQLIVIQEDAVVDFPDSNPIDVRVDAPGGDSPAFTMRADISELVPDLAVVAPHPGDIGRADVSMTLSAVGPGSSYTVDCVHESVDPVNAPTSDVYDQHLLVTCDFDDVAVNTYHVQVTVHGRYWTGFGEDVVTISDPSLGFTTGGGWFYWPGTADEATGYPGDKTNFGYTMKYNRKMTSIQGSFLMVRHLADGSTMRIKSNAVEALAIGAAADGSFGWASFTSKANWKDAGWLEPEGNYQVVVYVEDHGEPQDDRLWIELRDKDRNLVPQMTLDRTAPDHAPGLGGGNIFVPHTPSAGDGSSGGSKGRNK